MLNILFKSSQTARITLHKSKTAKTYLKQTLNLILDDRGAVPCLVVKLCRATVDSVLSDYVYKSSYRYVTAHENNSPYCCQISLFSWLISFFYVLVYV